MANVIRHKRGTTVPIASNLVTGELAINTSNGNLYTVTDGGSIVKLNSSGEATWGSVTGTLTNQTDLNTALGLKAPLVSPALTGTPTAPTADSAINNTQIATTAYVKSVMGSTPASFYQQGRNMTGSTIPAFSVVYISGVNSNLPTWALGKGDSSATSDKTFGVTINAINNNSNGVATTMGLISNINTQPWPVGTELWLSVATAGSVTSTQPKAPYHSVFIGTVITQSSSSGQVFIDIQNGYQIGDLHDVQLSSVSDADILTYDSASSDWKNKSISTLGLATQSYVTSIGYITDAPSNGSEYVRKNGGWAVSSGGGSYLPLAGGVLTGTIDIQNPSLTSNHTVYGPAGLDVYEDAVGNVVEIATWGIGVSDKDGGNIATVGGNLSEVRPDQIYVQNVNGGSTSTVTIRANGITFPDSTVQSSAGLSDAPSNGSFYARDSGAWVSFTPPAFGEAPTDGNVYGRQNGSWSAVAVNSSQVTTTVQQQGNSYYTTVPNDAGTIIMMQSGSDNSYYLSNDSTPIGSQIVFIQANGNQTTFYGTGVNLYSAGNRFKSVQTGSVVTAIKTDSTSWYLAGDLTN